MDAASPPIRSWLSPRSPLGARAVIGVTPCLDAGRRLRPGTDYWYLNRSYTRALAAAGAAPVLLSPDTPLDTCFELCDGLVLSGGGDLPESFGQAAAMGGAWVDEVPGEAESMERIAWERALLDGFATRGRAVLGVCFGMQLMNLHFGGTLHVNLVLKHCAGRGPGVNHGSSAHPTRHGLLLAKDSAFFSEWQPPATVSSSHGQAIADVAPGFVASAWATDGVVEAIEAGPLIGVEWHPESDASAEFVYKRFVETVLARR